MDSNQCSEPAEGSILHLKLFAQARQLAGASTVELGWFKTMNVAQLKQALAERYPVLTPLIPRLLVAVNNEYAQDDLILQKSDEVACFPPVSGG